MRVSTVVQYLHRLMNKCARGRQVASMRATLAAAAAESTALTSATVAGASQSGPISAMNSRRIARASADLSV